MNRIVRRACKTIERRAERGFTLLEYCAGAAVLLMIVYTGMHLLGDKLVSFLTAIGSWLDTHQNFAS